MTIKDLTDPQHVLRALAEFDSIGREAFLSKYGFGKSTKFMVEHDGKLYDSKAVLAAAHQYQTGLPLPHPEFSGGLEQTVQKLTSLGFTIIDVSDGELKKTYVESALDQFDSLGREQFLAMNKVPAASKFLISARNRRYDAKAILVVAKRMIPGNENLSADDVKSERAFVATPLEKLGYVIVEKESGVPVGENKISQLIERVLELQTESISIVRISEHGSGRNSNSRNLVSIVMGWILTRTEWRVSGMRAQGDGHLERVVREWFLAGISV